MAGKATAAQQAMEEKMVQQGQGGGVAGKYVARIQNAEAETYAGREMLEGASLEDKFAKLERDEKVERLLGEMKERQVKLLEA